MHTTGFERFERRMHSAAALSRDGASSVNLTYLCHHSKAHLRDDDACPRHSYAVPHRVLPREAGLTYRSSRPTAIECRPPHCPTAPTPPHTAPLFQRYTSSTPHFPLPPVQILTACSARAARADAGSTTWATSCSWAGFLLNSTTPCSPKCLPLEATSPSPRRSCCAA